jgi:hypothetical protein
VYGSTAKHEMNFHGEIEIAELAADPILQRQ